MQFFHAGRNLTRIIRYVKPYKNAHFDIDKDIVVLQLEQAIDFDNQYVGPICLPPKSNHSFDPNSCMAVGFGIVNENDGKRIGNQFLSIPKTC